MFECGYPYNLSSLLKFLTIAQFHGAQRKGGVQGVGSARSARLASQGGCIRDCDAVMQSQPILFAIFGTSARSL